ncbi:di-N-acetylchitobiase [Aplysia californica]|uniref:Di-N-acetylchitobiase n=1 Tax=Aplysia californica TaxID=6500 RepID=A0ABM0JVK4_APLCA|nr:di-N-acetylchitobiase [Aplysia californica]
MELSMSSRMLLAVMLMWLVPLARSAQCPCKDAKDCDYHTRDSHPNKEVFVFNKGTTSVSRWHWKSFTALIAPADFDINQKDQASTMCITHGNDRKFGISVKMDLTGSLNSSDEKAGEWLSSAVQRQREWHADILNVDLVPYFLSDVNSTKEDHSQLALILKKLRDSLNKNTSHIIEVSCMAPWKPPCAETSNTCDFSWISMDACDYFVLNGDSFLDVGGDVCRAGATIPLPKLYYGMNEYQAHQVPLNRMILGVPWHGFDYTCSSFGNDVCTAEKNDQEDSSNGKCDFKKKFVSFGDIMANYNEEYRLREYNDMDNAPFFNYKDNATQHQVWFEDAASLKSKYRLVVELKLRGVAVMYGDDLVSLTTPETLVNDGVMWSWVAHGVLLETAHKPEKTDLHTADTVAGVGVGCLLLGVFLGVLFTCLATKKRVKKPKPAFHRDGGGMDDFVDEDPDL